MGGGESLFGPAQRRAGIAVVGRHHTGSGGTGLQRSVVDVIAPGTGVIQWAAGERAGGAAGDREWLAGDDEAATDAGADRDVEEAVEVPARAEGCLGQGGGADVGLDGNRRR